jgi:glutathione synthase/RimK-type ligase-like ATP-grasp enzyme
MDEACRKFVAEECRLFVHDVWSSVEALWVPARPAAVFQAQHKASHLRLAGALGFELPPTLITNNPDDFLGFYREHGGRIVSKLVDAAFFRTFGESLARYTEPVTPRDVAYTEAVRYVPMIFQAYVPKRVELRITVVGRQVFAAEIHSQASNHTRHDWRRYDLSETPHAAHDLPPDVERRCVQLVARLGLCYGAIDMIVTPDGRYVFIEINPSGQYLWIEQLTGLPITNALCDLLIAGQSHTRPAPMPAASLAGGM